MGWATARALVVAATLALAATAPAEAAPRRSVTAVAGRARQVKRIEPRHSVVVIGARMDSGRQGGEVRHPLALAGPTDDTEVLRRAPTVRCDVCAATAAAAQPGQQSIFVLDLRSITNRLTTVQFRDATLRLTSVSPIGLQFRKPF